MSQSHEAAAKKNDLMQTKKIFEDDIGEDFLSSWKPSVLKNDVGLDFGNDTSPKAKKSSFSLDKFDVDFDFDGGFGKFSTFNVDMSDLDFRSPSSKTQKSKSKIQENSLEKKESKGDSFKFEFDFNGLDGFDLDCPLLKGKEETKIPEHEKLSMVSDESIEIAPKSKSKVLSKAINNNSEGNEDGTVPRGQTVAHSKFRLPELNMEEVESQEFAPKCLEISPGTSGSQDIETKPEKQTTAEKQEVVDTSFVNSVQTCGLCIIKEGFNPLDSKHPDNVSSSKTSSLSSGSGEKVSLQNASSTEDRLTLKDSRRDQLQSLAEGFVPKCLEISLVTSGSREIGTDSEKQTIAAKQDHLDTSFDNLFQTGGSNTMKKTFNPMESKHPDNVSSSKTSSFHSASGEKVSLQNASPMKDTLALKDSLEERQQSLAKTGPHHTEMPESDSSTKDSSPLRNECSKWSSDKCAPGSILKSSDTRSGKKVLIDRLNTLVQKDMDDNNERHMNQCQNPEASGEHQYTPSKTSFPIMQREITTRKPVTTSKHKLYLKESIGNQTTREEPKAMTEALVSTYRENSLQGLNKIGHTPSSAEHGKREALDIISSVSESKPNHHTQKRILSEVANITEPGERNGKHPLQGSSKLLYTETKAASIMIPLKYPPNHPSLQVSRTIAKNGKSPTILKQTNKKLLSSSKATINFSTNISISKNIQAFSEQKNTSLSPLLPLKRKPMEMCKMLKKKHEEAKDLLVRAIVNNNLLLMLNHPLHEEKIQAIQKHVSRMFPEGCRN